MNRDLYTTIAEFSKKIRLDRESLHGFDPQLSIRIDPSAIRRWGSSIPILSDHEREAAYARARMVLKAEMETLVVNHGWVLHVSQGELFESSDNPRSRVLSFVRSGLVPHLKACQPI